MVIIYLAAIELTDPINVTNNFSPWQWIGITASVIGGVFYLGNLFRIQFFKFMTEWKLSQLEMMRQIQQKQATLEQKVSEVHDTINNNTTPNNSHE